MRKAASLSVFFCFFLVGCCSGLLIRDLAREIDVTSQIAKHLVYLNAANVGSEFVSTFELAVLDSNKTLNFIKITAFGDELNLVDTVENLETKTGTKYSLYVYDLGKVLAPHDSVQITMALYYSNGMVFDPVGINQADALLVKYADNHLFFSPYDVINQKTEIRFPSAAVTDFTHLEPSVLKGTTLTYGPYNDMPAFSASPFELHFENNGPYIKLGKLRRNVAISHWGNIQISENYQMEHTGGILNGSFSRVSLARGPQSSPSVFTSLRQILPLRIFDVWFRDEIGNITTSSVSFQEDSDFFSIELTPRYPLYGGWKSSFDFGYSLFAEHYLRAIGGGRFYFNCSMLNYFEHDVIVDELEIRVVLPAGASAIEVFTDDPDVEISYDNTRVVLDVLDRKVAVITKKNALRENAAEYFQVSYKFSGFVGFLVKPILLTLIIFAGFVSGIVYQNMFSSTEAQETKEEAKAGLNELLGELKEQHELLCDHFANLLQVTLKYAKSKRSQMRSDQAKIKTLVASAQTEILKIQNGIASVDKEAGAAAREMSRKENIKYGYLKQMIENEIKYRNKDIVKKVYETTKAQIQTLYNGIDEELDRLVADLTDDL